MLIEHAWHSPKFATNVTDVSRHEWRELLGPVTQLLVDQGIDIDDKRGLDVDSSGPELGIDL
jgi:hypothetical protein